MEETWKNIPFPFCLFSLARKQLSFKNSFSFVIISLSKLKQKTVFDELHSSRSRKKKWIQCETLNSKKEKKYNRP